MSADVQFSSGPENFLIEDNDTFFTNLGLNTSLVAHIVVSKDYFLESCSQSAPVSWTVSNINVFLSSAGVPKKSLLTTDEFVLTVVAISLTLIVYYFVMGKRHVQKRKMLAESLLIAQAKVHYLEEKLVMSQALDNLQSAGEGKREIRIFMDGAFDMMHYGHMNAFRLGKSLGTQLIVGVNSDDSITKCKGPPLMNDQERLTMVQGCKFVDEVIPGCPYVMSQEYLEYVIEKYKIDYVVHGDDPCIVNGKDVYATAKQAGKYQSIPRTEGVSTTDIVGRMLLMTTDHHCESENMTNEDDNNDVTRCSLLCDQSKFLTTSRMLRLFSAGMKSPADGMRVIYMDGGWDMFHCGHVSILKEAKERGDYLIVGIHSDTVVNRVRGFNLPLMNVHERVLSVLGCRFVDDVLIDAPYVVTPEMISSLNIAEVVHGTNSDNFGEGNRLEDRYKYAKEAGIYKDLPSQTNFGLGSILNRIQANQQIFQAKIAKKKKAEEEYYNDRYANRSPSKLS